MGLLLSYFGSVIGIFIVLWGLNGLFQSAGGPASYSTISRWAPRTKRGKYLGLWNASHNVGGALAGGLALWGANVFFGGNVVGMFIFPALIGLTIGIIGLFVGKDDPEELGGTAARKSSAKLWKQKTPRQKPCTSAKSSLTTC